TPSRSARCTSWASTHGRRVSVWALRSPGSGSYTCSETASVPSTCTSRATTSRRSRSTDDSASPTPRAMSCTPAESPPVLHHPFIHRCHDRTMSADDIAIEPPVAEANRTPLDTSAARESFDVEPPYDTSAGELPEDRFLDR